MRIIVICNALKNNKNNPSSFRVRYLTALAMSEKGHNVIFAYPQGIYSYIKEFFFSIDEGFIQGLSVIKIPSLMPRGLRGFDPLECLFNIFLVSILRPDIVHVTSGHYPNSLVPSLFAKIFLRTSIVEETWEWMGVGGYADKRKSFIGKIQSRYDKFFEILFKNLYDLNIIISSTLKGRFKDKKKAVVLHGGAENNNLYNYTKKESRSLLNLPDNAFIIGMSNVVESDHQDNYHAFKALSIIQNKFKKILIVFTSQEDDYIKKIIKNFSFDDRIKYSGYLEFNDYNLHLSACDIFLLPYPDNLINRARWPNKFGDFLCLERPIISNPTGDLKEYFHNSKIGFLCENHYNSYCRTINDAINKQDSLFKYCKDSLHLSKNVLSFNNRIDKMLKHFLILRN